MMNSRLAIISNIAITSVKFVNKLELNIQGNVTLGRFYSLKLRVTQI